MNSGDFSISMVKANSKKSKDLGIRVLKGLRAHNKKFVPIDKGSPLTVEVKNSHGKVIGGLTAETAHGWLTIGVLWVDEKYRKLGIGAKLVDMAEEEAKLRGCQNAHLTTSEFQAHDFYKKVGYKPFGTIEKYVKGYSCYWMRKKL